MKNSQKLIMLKKSIKSLNLKEPIECIYAYSDEHQNKISFYYNDEIKLNINIIKMIQKIKPDVKISKNKLFTYVNDVKIKYNKQDDPDNINLIFDLK